MESLLQDGQARVYRVCSFSIQPDRNHQFYIGLICYSRHSGQLHLCWRFLNHRFLCRYMLVQIWKIPAGWLNLQFIYFALRISGLVKQEVPISFWFACLHLHEQVIYSNCSVLFLLKFVLSVYSMGNYLLGRLAWNTWYICSVDMIIVEVWLASLIQTLGLIALLMGRSLVNWEIGEIFCSNSTLGVLSQ